MNAFKIMNRLSAGDKSWQDVPYDVQKTILHSLEAPKNDIHRSYLQYKCQMFFRSHSKRLLFGFISFIIYPFLLLFLIAKGLYIPKREQVDCLGEFKGIEEIVPICLNREYSINNNYWNEGFAIRFKDLRFLLSVFLVAPLSPYFQLKVLLKVSSYSFAIKAHSPKAIAVHAEYSFCSSLLTQFCNDNGVLHINAMHGEKVYDISSSFFHYNRCYVWDEYYKKLLISLKAEEKQFLVEVPPSMSIDVEANYKIECFADYKYYLQTYDEEQIKSIVRSMEQFRLSGKKVIYRPHPRFSNMTLLKRFVNESDIEYPRKVNILNSVASCNVAIGYFSTVMNQAYLAGKTVILDDITYYDGQTRLKDRRYILSFKEGVNLLSKYLYEFTKTN